MLCTAMPVLSKEPTEAADDPERMEHGGEFAALTTAEQPLQNPSEQHGPSGVPDSLEQLGLSGLVSAGEGNLVTR